MSFKAAIGHSSLDAVRTELFELLALTRHNLVIFMSIFLNIFRTLLGFMPIVSALDIPILQVNEPRTWLNCLSVRLFFFSLLLYECAGLGRTLFVRGLGGITMSLRIEEIDIRIFENADVLDTHGLTTSVLFGGALSSINGVDFYVYLNISTLGVERNRETLVIGLNSAPLPQP